jgi:hypothetical protein
MPATTIRPSGRFILGLVLLILLALYSGWQSLRYYDITIVSRRYANFGAIASDSISRLESQLACLKSELEPGERVGFLSPLEGDAWVETQLWVQYALAPAIVTRDLLPAKVVAVFPTEGALQEAAQGYHLLHPCQGGIALLERAGEP